jgi:DNA repair exonuclease SbcCD nuclease subunit
MKIAILNDTHIGYKNSSELFFDYQKKFFDEFFDYCDKNDIKTILHLGDIFDHRKHISVKALQFIRVHILDEIRNRSMHMHILPGNHDIVFKNTLQLCSMFEILHHYKDCVSIHMNPKLIDFDGTPIGVVPWITEDNQGDCVSFITTAQTTILCGHFEIAGFRYIANSNMQSSGFDRGLFKRYDMVLSGHYHTKSNHDNITYLGSQYQFNWSDVDDRKYFHVLDTSTRDLTPVENTSKLYTKYYYDDTDCESIDELLDESVHNSERIKGNYVRVIVTHKNDHFLFDKYVDALKEFDPFDLQIIENFDNVFSDNDEDQNLVIEDTSKLLSDFVDANVNTDLDKDILKQHLNTLYTEAAVYDSI